MADWIAEVSGILVSDPNPKIFGKKPKIFGKLQNTNICRLGCNPSKLDYPIYNVTILNVMSVWSTLVNI